MEKRKIKEILVQGIILLAFAFMALGSATMNQDDACNAGYLGGKAIRSIIDN